jgi:hypothetical protein
VGRTAVPAGAVGGSVTTPGVMGIVVCERLIGDEGMTTSAPIAMAKKITITIRLPQRGDGRRRGRVFIASPLSYTIYQVLRKEAARTHSL